jgi:hypothetical protein
MCLKASSTGDLPHLGELAGFALYGNDRQFHDVRWPGGRAGVITAALVPWGSVRG